MSADNWATCPRCKYRHAKKYDEARSLADTSYGKVSREEWISLDSAAQALSLELETQTFREDYEIYGADEGEIEVNYRGNCGECGLSVTLKHTHKIDGVQS